MSQPKHSNPKRWYWLLIVPWIVALWVPFYNRLEPTLFGFPFFYWYQLALVGFASIIIAIVYYKAHVQPAADKNKRPTDHSGTGT
jgi:dolichyl-phosphate-mannose--protein O-mannosyl transferase